MKLQRLFILFWCCFWLPASISQAADYRIILKDGTIELTDKVWERGDYIHFILKGTKNVEIRYSKEIVSRIEKAPSATGRDIDEKAPALSKADSRVKQKGPENSGAPETEPKTSRQFASEPPRQKEDEKVVKENRGILFYNPRRLMRYWAGRQSKHKTLDGALDALAEHYHRSPQWVTTHMGGENDLAAIHRNLILQRDLEKAASPDEGEHDNPGEAGTVAPRAGNKTDTPTDDTGHASGEASSQLPEPGIGKGIKFYDPRRPEKYWSGQTTHHTTLRDAIAALADFYKVTPQWVQDHMGETNDLAEIHDNLRNSLASH